MTEIAVWRGWSIGVVGFWHHGILCPDGSVIHYTTPSGESTLKDKGNASILRTNLERFKAGADQVYEVKHDAEKDVNSPEDIVRRAESRIGQSEYNLMVNNCESFTKWCVTGDSNSRQITGHLGYAADGVKRGGLQGAAMGVVASALESSVLNCLTGKMVLRPDL